MLHTYNYKSSMSVCVLAGVQRLCVIGMTATICI